jgi:hypothetical protein
MVSNKLSHPSQNIKNSIRPRGVQRGGSKDGKQFSTHRLGEIKSESSRYLTGYKDMGKWKKFKQITKEYENPIFEIV